MKNVKWWHWILVMLAVMFVLGSLVEDPKTEQTRTTSTYEAADAEFNPLAGKDMFSIVFGPKVDPAELRKLVRKHCGSREFCKVFGWADPDFAPRGFPMTDREVEAQVLSYGINRTTGYEEFYWDCDKFGKMEGIDCNAADNPAESSSWSLEGSPSFVTSPYYIDSLGSSHRQVLLNKLHRNPDCRRLQTASVSNQSPAALLNKLYCCCMALDPVELT